MNDRTSYEFGSEDTDENSEAFRRVFPDDISIQNAREKALLFLLRFEQDPDIREDVVQNAFVQVLKNADSFRGESDVSTWFNTIAMNSFYMMYRWKSRRLHTLSLSEKSGEENECRVIPDTKTPSPVSRLIDEEVAQYFDRFIRRMPIIAYDRFIEKLSLQEIAEKRGKKLGTVKSLLHDQTKKVREEWEQAGLLNYLSVLS